MWLYLLHCTLSFVSIINAPSANFVCMAAFKAVKITVVFIAGYNFLSSEKNFHLFLLAMAATVGSSCWHASRSAICMGIYQVTGTFEHQNSLSMFVTMIGTGLLGRSLGPQDALVQFYLAGLSGLRVYSGIHLLRAGMVIFAAGTAGVAGLSCLDKFTSGRLSFLGPLWRCRRGWSCC